MQPKPATPAEFLSRESVTAYREWIQQGAARVSFEALCENHPGLKRELAALHELTRVAQSATFQRSVRKFLGEEADIHVALDEEEANAATQETGAATSPGSGIQPPEGYVLHGEIARGGMGIIYKVRDRKLNRVLAMKVMLSDGAREAASSDPHVTRFLEEVHVTAQLDHPGIVAVHELNLDAGGRPFFTMKLVKGRTLSEIFEFARGEKESWNLPRAVGAIVKACQAVAFAHSKGVIHRDLKPANIMVGRFGEVYVMDWGLAKVSGRKDLHDIRIARSPVSLTEIKTPRNTSGGTTNADSPLITMDGSVVGTPAYMPPEQAGGQVELVDAQSDIYSLGAILYSPLTGQTPYVPPSARLSPHTILARVLDGPPPKVGALNPKAAPELIAICEKAMARAKSDRYQSSAELAEDLQAWLDRRVVKAYRTGAMAEFKSWVHRNKGAALAGAAALLILCAGLAAVLFQNRRIGISNRAAHQSLYESLVREATATRIARRTGYRDHVFNLLRQARDLDAPQKDLALLRNEAVACLGDFVGLPPAELPGFPTNATGQTAVATRGNIAAFVLSNHLIDLRELPSGKPVDRLPSPPIWNLRFNHAGTRLVTLRTADGGPAAPGGGKSGSTVLRTWNRASEDKWLPEAEVSLPGAYDILTASNAQFIAVADAMSPSVRLLRLDTFFEILRFDLIDANNKTPSVAISPEGRYVIAEGPPRKDTQRSTLRLWDLQTLKTIELAHSRNERFLKTTFSQDGKHFVALYPSGGVLYETDDFKAVAEFRENFESWVNLSFRPATTILAIQLYQQGRVRFWDWVRNEDVATIENLDSINFSADGSFGLAWGKEGPRIHRFEGTSEKLSFPGHPGGTPGIAFSPDGSQIATVGKDRTLRVRNAINAQLLWEDGPLPGLGQAVTYSPDGEHLAVSHFESPSILIWRNRKRVLELSTTNSVVNLNWSLQFSPDGRYLASATEHEVPTKGAIQIWEIEQREGELRAKPFKFVSGGFVSLVFSKNSDKLAFIQRNARSELSLQVWDFLRTGPSTNGNQFVKIADIPVWSWQQVNFTPNAKQLLCWGPRRSVVLHDAFTGEQISSLNVGGSEVVGGGGILLSLSPDGGKLAITVSSVGVEVWDPKAGRSLYALPEQNGTVWWMGWSPDSHRLAISRSSGDISVWNLPEIEQALADLKLSK